MSHRLIIAYVQRGPAVTVCFPHNSCAPNKHAIYRPLGIFRTFKAIIFHFSYNSPINNIMLLGPCYNGTSMYHDIISHIYRSLTLQMTLWGSSIISQYKQSLDYERPCGETCDLFGPILVRQADAEIPNGRPHVVWIMTTRWNIHGLAWLEMGWAHWEVTPVHGTLKN